MSVYLITGAAQGLGKALTIQLIEQGHDVVLLDKDMGALNKLYDELNSDNAALYPMDLLGANLDHYQQLQEILGENYGKLDGVFLNAATLPAFTPIAQFDYKQWYEVLHTNLNANFHLIQTSMPLLLKASKGQLIAISDQNVEDHPAYYGAYGVAKAGLEQMIKSVAAETRELPVECYLAKLQPFATEARGRLFPGENPLELPQAEDMAKHILDIVLHGLNAELVHKL